MPDFETVILNDAADRKFMARALRLAEATVGFASPNPQVGCVLVRETAGGPGRIIGEGAHLYDARDHAEIVALRQAAARGEPTGGATAFVTLEPCSHHGRTGPCADALVAAGIARCVVATADPNPLVSGRGLARLRAAGVAVQVGVLQSAARALNDAFAFSITHDRPLVTLKAALSVDGQLAPAPVARVPGAPFWLTGPAARAEVQRLRHAHDAVLTGVGTVLADDPLLTDRSGLPRRRSLQRVVLDAALRTPPKGKLVQSAANDLWIFCAESVDPARARLYEQLGVRVVPVAPTAAGRPALPEILRTLHRAGCVSVLAEAGSTLNGALLQADLVERVALFYAETELGAGAIPFARVSTGPLSPFALEQRLLGVQRRSFGPDVCITGNLHDPWAGVA